MCLVKYNGSNLWGWASNFSKIEVSILHRFFTIRFPLELMQNSMLCMYRYIKDIERIFSQVFKRQFFHFQSSVVHM